MDKTVGKKNTMAFHGALMMIMTISLSTCIATASTIPADKSQLNKWFNENVKPLAGRKATLDPSLVAAEEGAKVVKVAQNGNGEFKTITEALKSIPDGNSKRVIVYIGPGVYNEKITIPRSKPFVTLYGDPTNMPTLVASGDAAKYGTVDSATLITLSEYFVAANLIIKNASPKPEGRKNRQALALRVSGTKSTFYNCRLLGFQDTLCDDRGYHFFKDCYIEGTMDFIFGSGKSIYLNTQIHVIIDTMSVIVAQAKKTVNEDVGYSFVHCSIIGTATGAFLGRNWMTYAEVVYAYTNIGSVISPKGWTDDKHPEFNKYVFYGEYKNTGPGASTSERVDYAKQLTDEQAAPFISLEYIKASTWLLPPPTPKV